MSASSAPTSISILSDAPVVARPAIPSLAHSLATTDNHRQSPRHGDVLPALSMSSHGPRPHQNMTTVPSVIPAKRRLHGSSSAPAHVCDVCQTVFERADHLSRHQRSHENAREYMCTRCPRRFNRTDLLSRHEATHDRDSNGRGRPSNRRSDRASEACSNCAISKSKCDDVKPCSRCESKNLVCKPPLRRAEHRRSWDTGSATSLSEVSPARSVTSNDSGGGHLPVFTSEPSSQLNWSASESYSASSYNYDANYRSNATSSYNTRLDREDVLDQKLFAPQTAPFRSGQVHWGEQLDRLTLPKKIYDQTNNDSRLHHHASDHFLTSPSQRTASPVSNHFAPNGLGLVMGGSDHGFQPPLPRSDVRPRIDVLDLTSRDRDAIFAYILDHQGKHGRLRVFPQLEFLNEVMREYFNARTNHGESLVHLPLLRHFYTPPELLASLIASGTTSLLVAQVQDFGLALAKSMSIASFSKMRAATSIQIDLTTAQVLTICTEVAYWSGIYEEMEQAENVFYALVTRLRRAGKVSFSQDATDSMPTESDSTSVIESKWQHFIRRESYKRLILRLYFLDVEASIALSRMPCISFKELSFSLPASPELWEADGADKWTNNYLALPRGSRAPPRVADLMEGNGQGSRRDVFGHDEDMSTKAMLYGWYGLVTSYRQNLASYFPGPRSRPTVWSIPERPISLLSQHEDLYRDICEFSRYMNGADGGIDLLLQAELMKMMLHVGPDHLQNLAGRNGPVEGEKALRMIEFEWKYKTVSQHALWHAGQVLRYAQELPPAKVRDFTAVAVYLAGLTLWAYTLIIGPIYIETAVGRAAFGAAPSTKVYIDGDDVPDVKAFLQGKQGTPAITSDDYNKGGTPSGQIHVLDIARGILYSSVSKNRACPPPIVESLGVFLAQIRMGYHTRHR